MAILHRSCIIFASVCSACIACSAFIPYRTKAPGYNTSLVSRSRRPCAQGAMRWACILFTSEYAKCIALAYVGTEVHPDQYEPMHALNSIQKAAEDRKQNESSYSKRKLFAVHAVCPDWSIYSCVHSSSKGMRARSRAVAALHHRDQSLIWCWKIVQGSQRLCALQLDHFRAHRCDRDGHLLGQGG